MSLHSPSLPRDNRPNRVPALDGVRAMAVLLVLVGHFGRVNGLARVGVIVFFVLSGYLITGLLLAEYHRRGTIDIPRFYLRRACRIFPAYYVFLAVSWLLLTQTTTPLSSRGLLATLTYTANYYSMGHPMELGGLIHTWSLSVEEQFYLLWPLSILLLLRLGMPWVRVGLVLAMLLGARSAASFGFGLEANAPWLAIGCLLSTTDLQIPAPRWLGHPVLAWIGTVSYPMYLWHMWGGAMGVQMLDGTAARFAVGVVSTTVLAAVSYYFLERPILRWRDRRFPTRPSVASAPTLRPSVPEPLTPESRPA